MTTVLQIKNIECRAAHGCLGEEKKIGGRFSVDVDIEMDLSRAIANDDLAHTADYVTIHNIVKEQMKTRSKLIEHAAGRILAALQQQYSSATNIVVTLTKYNPPVNGFIEKAIIRISFR